MTDQAALNPDPVGPPANTVWQDIEIMISYSTRPGGRGEAAKLLRSKLKELGASARLDVEDIEDGTRWRPKINGWLDSCNLAVVLASDVALESRWVGYEVDILSHRFQMNGGARDLEALLIVRLDGVETSDVIAKWGDAPQLSEIQMQHSYAGMTDEELSDAVVNHLTGLLPRRVPPLVEFGRRGELVGDRLPPGRYLLRVSRTLGVESHWTAACRRGSEDSEGIIAIGREWCRAAHQDLLMALRAVNKPVKDPFHREQLVDLPLMAFFDGGQASVVADHLGIGDNTAGRRRAVVVGARSATVANLVVYGAFMATSDSIDLDTIRLVPVSGWPEGQDAPAMVDRILKTMVTVSADGASQSPIPDPETARAVVATSAESGWPDVALITDAHAGLTQADVDLVQTLLPGIALVFVTSTPIEVAAGLGLDAALPTMSARTEEERRRRVETHVADGERLETSRRSYLNAVAYG